MALKENVEAFAENQALAYMDKDPEKNLPKLRDWFDRFDRKDTLKKQRDVIREVVLDTDNNWHKLVMSLWTDIDPGVRTAGLRTLSSTAAFWDTRDRRRTRKSITAISRGRS